MVGWRTGGGGIREWEPYLESASDEEPPDGTTPRPNLIYTSGTTGTPKGTEHPPTMFGSATTIAEHLAGLRATSFAAFGTHLVVGPLYHTGPLSGVRLLLAGVPLVVLDRFDAEATLTAIEAHRVESTVMVPTHFIRLLALPDGCGPATTCRRWPSSPTPAPPARPRSSGR